MLPYLVGNTFLQTGYSLIGWLAYKNQKELLSEALKLSGVKYIRDIYGNTPMLYALKR